MSTSRRTVAGWIAAGVALTAAARAASASQPPADDEDVEVTASPNAAPLETPPAGPTPDLESLRKQLETLQAKVDRLEAAQKKEAPPPKSTKKETDAPSVGIVEKILGVSAWAISAYVQAQYEWHQDSEDQLQQGGAPLNQDRFLVRRGRLRLDAAWAWTALAIEIDGNTTRGPAFGIRRAEASFVWRGPWGPDPSDLAGVTGDGKPPLMMLTAGLTEIPFGFEMTYSARDRVFMERSQSSLAFFPSEPDVGVRLSGGASFFRYGLAVLNGEPLDERAGQVTRERNSEKDIVGRLGAETDPTEWLHIGGGVSALRGQGFHPGTDATKDSAQWRDLNENGAIDSGEVTANPGVAATPSENFGRWAVGIDLQLRAKSPLGQTFLYGEAALATNLDRGLVVADPVATGIDKRELGIYGAIVQEITPYALVGFRIDVYDPNADFFDTRGGKLLPTSQVVRTLSPVLGGAIPGRGRLILQYDNVDDSLTRDAVGVPVDLENDRFTARLQVQL